MIDNALYESLKHFDSATLYEASGQHGALPHEIKPVHPDFYVIGRAFPVLGPPGDNLWLHRAIAAAAPGDVLVISVRGAFDHGYWGEVMSIAARERDLAGLIIDGCVRDGSILGQIGFPIFSRGLCIRGTTKDAAGLGSLNAPILVGDVVVQPGDIMFGDIDGVVSIARDRFDEVVSAAQQRRDKEASIIERLTKGETTLHIYDLPPVPVHPEIRL